MNIVHNVLDDEDHKAIAYIANIVALRCAWRLRNA